MGDIYLKIYMENEDTLVFEGQGTDDKEGYYPTRWDDTAHRIGTVAVGKEHIAISESAKDAFRRIVKEANHTGDDISCIDIHRAYKRVGDGFEKTPTDVAISYLGPVVTRLSVEEVIKDPKFFISYGEGMPELWLLDELSLLEEAPKSMEDEANDKRDRNAETEKSS